MHRRSQENSNEVPNPFERRQFAFRVLPEEKDPMSRAKKYSYLLPTLTVRLQQLLCTRLWESMMLILSIWSFVPLLIRPQLPKLEIFFELTHQITQAALFVEVFCKLYTDWRWFFYDSWNFYDLFCVILNSPFVYNLFLSDHLGIPQMNSIQRFARTLHTIRLIRIHSLLRFVIETMFIALSSIYHTLLLELIVITVFALLSIAFEGDTDFANPNAYEPYENYTEALYSYYMCLTLEGVNEVAEHILQLNTPQLTTVIGMIFYIVAAIVTYSVGQLLAAVVAATLDKAINQINQNRTSSVAGITETRLLGIQHPTLDERKITKARCSLNDEIANFSRLIPDDLAFLIILFRIIDQNIDEFQNILYDIHQIGQSIAKINEKNFIFNSLNNEQLFLQQQRLKIMLNTLNKIIRDLSDDDDDNNDEIASPFEDVQHSPNSQPDLHLMFQSIEEKFLKIEQRLKRNSFNTEQNQHHRHILDRLKDKFYKNISNM